MLYPAQACILLIVSISALEFNICFSHFFSPKKTQYLINQWKIERAVKYNCFEVVSSTESCQNFLLPLLYKASFCDETEKFSILFWCVFLPSKCTSSIPYHNRDSYFQMLPNLLKESYGSVLFTSIF